MQIFRTLMAKRATGLSPEHVEALNRIEIEFYGKDTKSKAVFDAWKEYHDHLHASARDGKLLKGEDLKHWASKKEELLTELLYQMALSLGYSFDKVHIKRGHYYPTAYGNLELEQMIIREGLVRIMTGESALPMDVRSFPAIASDEELKQQEEIRKTLLKYFDGKIPVPVKLIKKEKGKV